SQLGLELIVLIEDNIVSTSMDDITLPKNLNKIQKNIIIKQLPLLFNDSIAKINVKV
ncbi:9626_t:CDS:2, partial [Dentiscutata erythropus]